MEKRGGDREEGTMNYVASLSATRGKRTSDTRQPQVDRTTSGPQLEARAEDKRITSVHVQGSDGQGPLRILTSLTAAGLINGDCCVVPNEGKLAWDQTYRERGYCIVFMANCPPIKLEMRMVPSLATVLSFFLSNLFSVSDGQNLASG